MPAVTGEPLVETINRALPARHLPQVCYHPQLGPIETCDCCMVEVDGELRHTPAYKEISVELTVLPEVRPNPLPPSNFRHGHPNPQFGVEVQRKWKRADYVMPGSVDGNQLVQITTKV